MNNGGIDRRDFLKGAAGTLALLLSAKGLTAAEATKAEAAAGVAEAAVPGPPVKVGVIGLGQWGKDIVASLSRIPSAKIVGICDTYEAYLKRGKKLAPDAVEFADYRKLLESDVEAVVVATPTHQHREIVLAALQAGKHVYCEAPIAASIEDAKTIALAGQNSKQVFQAGLQGRTNPLLTHVSKFVKTGCLGNVVQAQAQFHKKQSWRRMAPTPEREKEINWRLDKSVSVGLIGEEGIHSLDLANWYLGSMPVAVSAYGQIMSWKDGREVPDTVQCLLEYPNNVRMIFDLTIANSFSGAYTLFQGSDCSLMLRDDKGWMIKEADSALLGWEVYAKKEEVFGETGICMVADATKILQDGKEPGQEAAAAKDSLYVSLESFTRSIRENSAPASGAVEGYQAAVVAIKANQAAVSNSRVEYSIQDFELK